MKRTMLRATPLPALWRTALWLSALWVTALWLTPGIATASPMTISHPGVHPTYDLEVEPHGLVGVLDPPGAAHGNGYGFGARLTYTLVGNGFVKSINNSVGLSSGVDWLHYIKGDNSCARATNPGGNCDLADDQDEGVPFLTIPVVLQWNFWLTRDWSVFGEPGIGFSLRSNGREKELGVDVLHLYLGGRWHFTDYTSLTLRIGYPAFSVGVSFLL